MDVLLAPVASTTSMSRTRMSTDARYMKSP